MKCMGSALAQPGVFESLDRKVAVHYEVLESINDRGIEPVLKGAKAFRGFSALCIRHAECFGP